jgi:hypothetical protein
VNDQKPNPDRPLVAAASPAKAAAPLSRRTLFVGAGAVSAVAAAAVVLPRSAALVPPALQAAAPPLAADGGYQLTEHVKRYYQTARV